MIFMQQFNEQLYINPAIQDPGVRNGPLDLEWEKVKKIFSSSLKLQGPELLYFVCSNV